MSATVWIQARVFQGKQTTWRDAMKVFFLHNEHITLAHAIKAAGLADSGGQAKLLVREGQFTVNGEVEIRPGRKLFAGDRFGPAAGEEWEMRRETSEG